MQSTILKLAVATAVFGCAASMSTAPASAAKACEGTATAPPFSDWTYTKGSAGVAGHPGFRKGYDLQLQSNAGVALAEVKGFNDQNQVIWAPVPAMSPDSPHRIIEVAWGNNLAMPEVRVKPAPGQITGVVVTFKC